MREVLYIVQRIVVSYHHIVRILQHAIVAKNGRASIVWKESSDEPAGAHRLPTTYNFILEDVCKE